MNNINIKYSLATIKGFFNSTLNRKIGILAKQVGFTKRNDGKLLPETFVKAFTFGLLNESNPTLVAIANACEGIQKELSISKEAIYQRMEAGTALLKEIFAKSIEYSVNTAIEACDPEVLKRFNNVYIVDSSIITLSKRMSKIAPGKSAKGEKGSLCIQNIFSLVNRCFKKIEVFWGTHNDMAYTRELANNVCTNDLIIFDMGYRNKIGYKEISEKEAFFLTRAMHNSIYYNTEEKGKYPDKELDIVSILKKSEDVVDMEVLMGADPKRRIKCRFVAIRLPDDVVNERTRKAYKKRRKSTLSKKELELLKWNTFITNAPVEKITPKNICHLYRLRWQIEIIFKACKSHLRIAALGIGGRYQTECLIYGRLINAIIMASVYSKYYSFIYKMKQREVSIIKFFSNIKNKAQELNQIMYKNLFSLIDFIKLFDRIAGKSLYEKRERRSSLQHLIDCSVPILELPA
jgi:hypothetical protein